MSPGTAAWLANVVVIQSSKGRVVIFPDEVVGKADEELLALVRARLNEQRTVTPRAV